MTARQSRPIARLEYGSWSSVVGGFELSPYPRRSIATTVNWPASREIARGIELALERRAGLARGEDERRGRLRGHRGRVGSDRRHRAHRVYRPDVGRRHRVQVAELIAGPHGQGVAAVREAGQGERVAAAVYSGPAVELAEIRGARLDGGERKYRGRLVRQRLRARDDGGARGLRLDRPGE